MMKTKPQVLITLRSLFSVSRSVFSPISKAPVAETSVWAPVARISTITASINENPVGKTRVSTQLSGSAAATALINGTPDENLVEDVKEDDLVINSTDVFRKLGCSDSEIDLIFERRPSLRATDPNLIRFKLNVLSLLGMNSSDLVKIICSRPRFLSCGINRSFDERIKFFLKLFGSSDLLRKAIIRNPSLLIYNLDGKIKPVVELYKGMGVAGEDFVSMVLSRPPVISRTSFNDEKLEYIRRTGVSKKSRMYKYVVALMGVSRLETIREKMGNLERFGFSEDEVLGLFGRSPLVLTLSVDKVQRNMTFVLGTMKLPARAALKSPFLLYANLETILKPRFLLAVKIEEMGLIPQIKGPKLFGALRMKEDKFLATFVTCHPEPSSKLLVEYYRSIKDVKRLAIASKKRWQGFPF